MITNTNILNQGNLATILVTLSARFYLYLLYLSESPTIRFSCDRLGCLQYSVFYNIISHTHTTHTRLTALFPELPRWAGRPTRKVKPIWILLKQDTVSGSGISWAICKSAPRSRHITTPAPHQSSFLQAGCPSCRPTNSVKALKEHNIIT